MSLLRSASILFVSSAVMGCSAIVAPDLTRLGGDAGPGPGLDGGPAVDAGPGVDGGPRVDAGPGVDGGPIGVDGGPIGVDGGPIGVDGGPTCTPSCVGSTRTTCAGGLGIVEICELGCAPGGAVRCAEMLPSNVPAALLMGGTRDLNVTGTGLSFDTSTCPSTVVDTMVVPQSAGPELCVMVVRDARVQGVLSVRGRRPLVIIASGEIRVDGTIDVAAELARPGPGGGNGGTATMRAGLGLSPGTSGGHVGTYTDGGGGGGGFCGAGGAGGGAGTTAPAMGGAGGAAVPSLELSPLVGGSGGGTGPGGEPATGTVRGNSGLGGGGGGALQLTSATRIRIDGTIYAGGGGGIGGRNNDLYVNWGAGGGGGSGGGILLEAPAIEVTGELLASGGGGASSSGSGFLGVAGDDGLGLGPSDGGPASGFESYSAAGGDSGGGATLAGLGGGTSANASGNGGGGGGGAGCLVLRTGDGTDPGGTRSPSAGVSVLTVRLR